MGNIITLFLKGKLHAWNVLGEFLVFENIFPNPKVKEIAPLPHSSFPRYPTYVLGRVFWRGTYDSHARGMLTLERRRILSSYARGALKHINLTPPIPREKYKWWYVFCGYLSQSHVVISKQCWRLICDWEFSWSIAFWKVDTFQKLFFFSRLV